MEFTQITAKSPEKLVDALNAEEKLVSIKTLCGMMWQPHGAVVIVGYEKHAPAERPAAKGETASKKKPRRNLVKELEAVEGGLGDSGDDEIIHSNSAGDSGSTRAN